MARKVNRVIAVPDDARGAFAGFIGQCASAFYKELARAGGDDTETRNEIIRCCLDFAAGEACLVARRSGRKPDRNKWREATDDAFARAVKRTGTTR